jgi:hypothetical protein
MMLNYLSRLWLSPKYDAIAPSHVVRRNPIARFGKAIRLPGRSIVSVCGSNGLAPHHSELRSILDDIEQRQRGFVPRSPVIMKNDYPLGATN